MQIRLAAENGDPDLTFKPLLNDRSLRMAEELREAQELREAAQEVQAAPCRPASAGAWPPATRLPMSPHPLRPTPGIELARDWPHTAFRCQLCAKSLTMSRCVP